MADEATTRLLELDDRRRTSFGRIGRRSDTRYLATEYPNGDIYLTPAHVVSTRELELLADPAALAALQAGVDDAHAGRISPLELDRLDPT